jgi:biotin carboxyl carrier protein
MAGLSVESLGNGWYIVTDGDRRWHVAVASSDGDRWVFVDGLVTNVSAAREPNTRSRARGAGDTGLMAPMPATVVAIHVNPGQAVESGDTLIVLEAMKMELPLRSPRSGVVKSIHCQQGELVQPGIPLLEMA